MGWTLPSGLAISHTDCRKERMSLLRPFRFPTAEWTLLRDRSFLAQQIGHLEVCGVFGVTKRNEIRLYFIPNRIKKPYAFRVYRRDVIRIEKLAAKSSIQVRGTFHSHPISEAVPGENDYAQGFYRNHLMIYDVCGEELAIWHRDQFSGKLKLLDFLVY